MNTDDGRAGEKRRLADDMDTVTPLSKRIRTEISKAQASGLGDLLLYSPLCTSKAFERLVEDGRLSLLLGRPGKPVASVSSVAGAVAVLCTSVAAKGAVGIQVLQQQLRESLCAQGSVLMRAVKVDEVLRAASCHYSESKDVSVPAPRTQHLCSLHAWLLCMRLSSMRLGVVLEVVSPLLGLGTRASALLHVRLCSFLRERECSGGALLSAAVPACRALVRAAATSLLSGSLSEVGSVLTSCMHSPHAVVSAVVREAARMAALGQSDVLTALTLAAPEQVQRVLRLLPAGPDLCRPTGIDSIGRWVSTAPLAAGVARLSALFAAPDQWLQLLARTVAAPCCGAALLHRVRCGYLSAASRLTLAGPQEDTVLRYLGLLLVGSRAGWHLPPDHASDVAAALTGAAERAAARKAAGRQARGSGVEYAISAEKQDQAGKVAAAADAAAAAEAAVVERALLLAAALPPDAPARRVAADRAAQLRELLPDAGWLEAAMGGAAPPPQLPRWVAHAEKVAGEGAPPHAPAFTSGLVSWLESRSPEAECLAPAAAAHAAGAAIRALAVVSDRSCPSALTAVHCLGVAVRPPPEYGGGVGQLLHCAVLKLTASAAVHLGGSPRAAEAAAAAADTSNPFGMGVEPAEAGGWQLSGDPGWYAGVADADPAR